MGSPSLHAKIALQQAREEAEERRRAQRRGIAESVGTWCGYAAFTVVFAGLVWLTWEFGLKGAVPAEMYGPYKKWGPIVLWFVLFAVYSLLGLVPFAQQTRQWIASGVSRAITKLLIG